MTAFPEITSVPFINPVVEQLQFKTLITNFDDLGREQRKQKNLYPKRAITLKFEWLTKLQAQVLYQFYIDRAGAFNVFKFFLPSPRGVQNYSYVKEYVGTGDGATRVYSLPSRAAAAYTVYIDSVAKSSPSDYSFSVLGGPDGEDKITFVDQVNAGGRITFSFTGQLKVVCRFKDDELSFESFFDKLVNTGVQLQGLLNDDA